jgi:hypothetical protein
MALRLFLIPTIIYPCLTMDHVPVARDLAAVFNADPVGTLLQLGGWQSLLTRVEGLKLEPLPGIMKDLAVMGPALARKVWPSRAGPDSPAGSGTG